MGVIQVGETRTDGSDVDDNVTFTKPTGVASGDLLIAVVSFVDVWTLSPPSGWTLLNSVEVQNTSLRNSMYTKVAGGSEPASYAFSTGSGNDGIINGGLFALRESEGRVLSIDHASNGPGGGQNWATPGVTQTKPGRVFHYRAGKHATGTSPNYTLSGWTEMWDLDNDGGSIVYAQAMYIGFSDSDVTGAEPGVTINSSVTVTNSTSNMGRTFVVGYDPGVDASAGVATASAAANVPSMSISGQFVPTTGAATATANNATAKVGAASETADLGIVMGLANTWAIVPTSDPAAVALDASVAFGGEVSEEARATATGVGSIGYYGAPKKRRATVAEESRTYTIPRVR